MLQDQLQIVYDAVQSMRAAKDLESCLRFLVQAVYKLGWMHVAISVALEPAVTLDHVEKPEAVQEALAIHARAEKLWSKHEDAPDREQYRLGISYYFPQGDGAAWHTDDLLITPIWY